MSTWYTNVKRAMNTRRTTGDKWYVPGSGGPAASFGTVRPALSRMSSLFVVLQVILFHVNLPAGDALKFLGIEVPLVADPRADKVTLRCEYDLEDAELYSVKWYKDGKEFFMYMPGSSPPGCDFQVEGIKVDVKRSDSYQLVLLGSSDLYGQQFSLAGAYGCEVSTEGPNFLTAYREANMSVAVLPKKPPVLEGVRPNYEVGELLEAECTSAPSYPLAELAFLLNDRQVSSSLTRNLPDLRPEGILVSTTRLGLSLRLERHHFPGGSFTLTCRAVLPGISVARALSTDVSATLSASNQRLAQEPPRSGSAVLACTIQLLEIFFYYLIIA
ncbi:uncharacterized protein LOC107272690 [Cephus cinctus]|uniref:Uncharacterized protein LOC107272690 n=1 Tax=Cephus cinctus TaxID=211228 RepID=A0AAJ7CB12_CEPCN|nr:uncharacterized protein LOC107272690 [Cephus cinctus]